MQLTSVSIESMECSGLGGVDIESRSGAHKYHSLLAGLVMEFIIQIEHKRLN